MSTHKHVEGCKFLQTVSDWFSSGGQNDMGLKNSHKTEIISSTHK
jgi:hypothetical protein